MAITSLDQLDLNGTYTYADYLTWQFSERLELFKGKIALMSPAPNRQHQKIVGNLYVPFFNHFKKHICEVYIAPFDVRLPNQGTQNDKVYTVVQPDICVICDPDKLDDKGCIGAPDLVIEVLSPGNSRKEMRDKYSLYESAGVKEYWLVLPSENTLMVYTLNNEGQFIGKQPVTETETIGSDLFPGLSIELKEVFP
ncbi:MAG: Uma2 family endonuclease [Bacteroidota bacterium]